MCENNESIPYSVRCPENVIPKRKSPSDEKRENIICWELPKTENQDKFKTPRRRKQIVTRDSHYENFLWHQFYQEYMQQMHKKFIKEPEKSYSEYNDRFSQIKIPDQSEEEMQNLMEKYPIYASGIISFYNPEGRKKGVFNRAMNITRPIAEQYNQFG